jgi:L-serine dehydratase
MGGLAATKTGQAIAKRVLIREIEILPDEPDKK